MGAVVLDEVGDDSEQYDPVDAILGDPGSSSQVIYETTSSGMFDLDRRLEASEANKLQFVVDAARNGGVVSRQEEATARDGSALASVEGTAGMELYIHICRGEQFADSFDPSFFPKTFPTLFPYGRGGPKLAEEAIAHARADRRESTNLTDGTGTFDTVRELVASRNMSLGTWAAAVLRRHGGRFASHYVFPFLIFNMEVRSANRRVSMLSIQRPSFTKVEEMLSTLSPERLERAKADLEAGGKTDDVAVQELLQSLSMYGYRQPLLRESCLSMRRKIKSYIIGGGIPVFWNTLSPNDITNQVKLRLSAYRIRPPAAAEDFL